MKKICILILLILLVSSCLHHCDDVTSRNFTDTELEWFSFGERDTLFFRDVHTDSVYYLICTDERIKYESEFTEEGECSGGGYLITRYVIKSKFDQNFPNGLDYDVLFELKSSTGGPHILVFEILFYRAYDYPWVASVHNSYFNDETEVLYSMGGTVVTDIDMLTIQQKTYEKVSKIYCRSCVSADFYDTIYFNDKGFLKFSSSHFGYDLERIE